MKVTCIEQEIRYRDGNGVDYGCDGKILMRVGTGTSAKRLMWEGGSKYWARIGEQGYRTSELSVTEKGQYDDRLPHSTTITKGGRLSKRRVVEHRERIAELMGVPVSAVEQIDPKRTLVVERTS